MATLRLAPEGTATDVGIVLFTTFLVGWMVTPLLAFGLDDTLDPSRLSLFPLRTGQLAVGMFATSVTGVWPIATLIIMSGASPAWPRGSVACCWASSRCCCSSRSASSPPGWSPRRCPEPCAPAGGRDVLAVAVVFFILAAQLPNLLLNGGLSGDSAALLHGVASVLRWTPPGMAAHAIADGGIMAVAELALPRRPGRCCRLALDRGAPPGPGLVGRLHPRRLGQKLQVLLARVLPDGPLAAVVTKELKYARRDPRGRVGWFAAIAVTGIMAFSLSRDAGGTGSIFLAVAPACIGGVMIGLQTVNLFGIDGRSLWMNSVVYGTGRDWRTDLAGRHLAVAAIAVPLLALMAVVAAFLAGDLLWAVPAALTAWGVLGVMLGVGALTSVLLPYTVPERLNAFTGAGVGQGGIAFGRRSAC